MVPTYARRFPLTVYAFFYRCEQPRVVIAFLEATRMDFRYCCCESFHLYQSRKMTESDSRMNAFSKYFSANVGSMNIHFYNFYRYNFTILSRSRAESSTACEVCEGAEEMTEPLTQCAAWLRAYFCQPARMTSLPVPAFHHPLLQRGLCHRAVPPVPSPRRQPACCRLPGAWSLARRAMRFSSQQWPAGRLEDERV